MVDLKWALGSFSGFIEVNMIRVEKFAAQMKKERGIKLIQRVEEILIRPQEIELFEMKTKESNDYGDDATDDERSVRGLKSKGLDIEEFEIHPGKHGWLEKLNAANPPIDEDYITFLKGLLLEAEPSSSGTVSDDDGNVEDDADPHYKIFLKNVRKDGVTSHKFEMAMENRMVSMVYEGEDDSDDDCDMPSPIKSKQVLDKKNIEVEDHQNIGSDKGRVRDNVNKKAKLKSDMFTKSSPRRYDMGARSSPRLCNTNLDSTQSKRRKTGKETIKFKEKELKSIAMKDLKNVCRRTTVESPKSLRRVRKSVEDIRIHTRINSKSRKRKLEERYLKSRSADSNQVKTNESGDIKSSAKLNNVFGCDWQHEVNGDDVDECYRIFLNSITVEGSSIGYESGGQKRLKQEALDDECSKESEVVETPKNDLQGLTRHERGTDSVFRKQLMAKLGEPYKDKEYKELWEEINKERPKMKHYDLRGSRSERSFPSDELSPSYLSTYAPLRKEIVDFCHDKHRRLKYLRGFFFWLQNVAHEDAFEPWLDKTCLEVMRKG